MLNSVTDIGVRSVKPSVLNPRLFNKGKNVIVSLIFKYRNKGKNLFFSFSLEDHTLHKKR